MTQKLMGMALAGTGFYLLYLNLLIVGLILVALGAGVYNGASHGKWFHIGGDQESAKPEDGDD